jgi:hypothetical protein
MPFCSPSEAMRRTGLMRMLSLTRVFAVPAMMTSLRVESCVTGRVAGTHVYTWRTLLSR